MTFNGNDSYFRRIIDGMLDAGWKVSKTRRGHYKCRAPSGMTIFTSGTPSDWRAIHNFAAKVRRVQRTQETKK